MRKIVAKMGYVAYEVTHLEIALLGGYGICDECNNVASTGYLVPVLNHYQCPECFKDWSNRGHYYPEDVPVEKKNAVYYEGVIPITE